MTPEVEVSIVQVKEFQYFWRPEVKEQMDKWFSEIKKEKNKADFLKIILKQFYESQGYLIRTERNPQAWNYHPFDLVAGKCETVNGNEIIEILGFEIKADTDTLKRLDKQLPHYKKYCDKVYIVTHKKEVPDKMDVGLIRISTKNEMYIQDGAYHKLEFFEDVSTVMEMKKLLQQQGLGGGISAIKESFDIPTKIWKKILFNRFFGNFDFEKQTFIKFFPFTEEEFRFLAKLSFSSQITEMRKKSIQLRRLTEALTAIIETTGTSTNIGQAKVVVTPDLGSFKEGNNPDI